MTYNKVPRLYKDFLRINKANTKRENEEQLLNGHGVYFGEDGNFWNETEVVIVPHCDCTRCN